MNCRSHSRRLYLREEEGKTYEPFEEVVVDTPSEFQGPIIERLGVRGLCFAICARTINQYALFLKDRRADFWAIVRNLS